MDTDVASDERHQGIPLTDSERVARHYNISLDQANTLLSVYTLSDLVPARGSGLPSNFALVGYSEDDLRYALNVAEENLAHGEQIEIAIVSQQPPTEEELAGFYVAAAANGHHLTSYPVTTMEDGLPVTSFNVKKGSPLLLALIPIIPTVLIIGLVAFGITRLSDIQKVLMPILLVSVGALILLAGMLTRKPVLESAERILSKRLASTKPKYLPAVTADEELKASGNVKVLTRGDIVTMRSGSEGWVRGEIVERVDIFASVPGGIITQGQIGYMVHILEGKHKGETIKLPDNYVHPLTPGARFPGPYTKTEPASLYWIRIGDVGKYHSFNQSFDAGKAVGKALTGTYETGLPGKSYKISYRKDGVEIDPLYTHLNYIPLFVGDADNNFIDSLAPREKANFELGLIEGYGKSTKRQLNVMADNAGMLKQWHLLELHDDGDLTIEDSSKKLYVVTTAGEMFSQIEERRPGKKSLSHILASEFITIDSPGKTAFKKGEDRSG